MERRRRVAQDCAPMQTLTALTVVNPTTGAPLRDVPCDAPADVDAKLERARTAQRRWREKTVDERVGELRAALEYFRREKEAVAHDVTREMGKPVREARGEVE